MKSETLAAALRAHEKEVRDAVAQGADWAGAAMRMDAFFARLSNPKDPLWSAVTIQTLSEVYFSARDRDECSGNITLRTVAAMPAGLRDDTKKILLQIASVCGFFNGSHKVNFEAEELPANFPDVPTAPGKKKGLFTFAAPMPALYPKTSLTFDYWVPKILEWAAEVRSKGLKSWRGPAILEHESCTDFMRIALLFLSAPADMPPVAKQEHREALIVQSGGAFAWIKKSQKREDILKKNAVLQEVLNGSAKAAGLKIPLEAWSRLFPLPFLNPILGK